MNDDTPETHRECHPGRGERHSRHRHGCGCNLTDGEPCPRITTRVQLELPPQAMERLQRLKEKSEAASYAEVIRGALRIFEALLEEHEKGTEITLKRANGEMVAYKIFL
jgi:hypothetical protein